MSSTKRQPPRPPERREVPKPPRRGPLDAALSHPIPGPLAPVVDPRQQTHLRLLAQLVSAMDRRFGLANLTPEQILDEETWEQAEDLACDLVEQLDEDGRIPAFINQDELIKDTLNESLGLGPLEDLLVSPEVRRIEVHPDGRVGVSVDPEDGPMALAPSAFSSTWAVQLVIERWVKLTGERIDTRSPRVQMTTHEGVQVTATIPPLSPAPTLVICK